MKLFCVRLIGGETLYVLASSWAHALYELHPSYRDNQIVSMQIISSDVRIAGISKAAVAQEKRKEPEHV